MTDYKLHEKAREDLDEIWNFLAGEASPSIASRIEDEFFQAFALISIQPRMVLSASESGFEAGTLLGDA